MPAYLCYESVVFPVKIATCGGIERSDFPRSGAIKSLLVTFLLY